MKKRIILALLVLCLGTILFGVITANAATYGNYTYTVSNGEVEIIDFSTSVSGAITIPSEIEGYPVTSIGSSAFYKCTGLTSVEIPDSVTSIGNGAFYCCTGLTSVEIPDSVTSIGRSAFSYCRDLTEVVWNAKAVRDFEYSYYNFTGPSDVFFGSGTSKGFSVTFGDTVERIPAYAFYECTGLTNVKISGSVTSIGYDAFNDCTGLTSVEIPNSVTSIGSSVFEGCTELTSIEIPDSVTSIGSDAFKDCTGLTSVEIPNSVTSIGSSVFEGCTGLTSVEIPDSVKTIGSYAFRNCTGLTSVKIPDSVTSIGASAFYGCTGLTSVTIPDSVTSIGDYAFYGCTGLTSVKIPDSVTSIGSSVFEGCTGLTSVEIPNSVTSIGDYAFYGCTGLTSVEIPDSVTSIKNFAFSGAGLIVVFYEGTKSEWENIYGAKWMPSDVIYIYNYKEKECEYYFTEKGVFEIDGRKIAVYYGKDTEVTIPQEVNGVKINEIAENTFSNGETIEKISIPEGIVKIGKNAFGGTAYYDNSDNWENGALYIDSYLIDTKASFGDDFCIKDGTKAIASYAFDGFRSLDTIVLPEGLTDINQYAFSGIETIDTLVLPKSLSRIGYSAFKDCTEIKRILYVGSQNDWTAVSIGDGNNVFLNNSEIVFDVMCENIENGYYIVKDNKIISYIGDEQCVNIPSVINGEEIISIGEKAFMGNASIEVVTVPYGVESIETHAFKDCIKLYEANLPNSVNTMGAGVFNQCENIKKVKLPQNIESLGGAFGGSGLEYIELPSNLKSIESGEFINCENLKYIIIPDSVESIGDLAFSNCSSLENVSIGCNVKHIGDSAFGGCTSLERIVLPDSVESLGNYFLGGTFKDCTSLKSITIGSGIKEVPAFFANNAINLEELNFTSETTKFHLFSLTEYSGSGWSYKLDIKKINYVGTPTQYKNIEATWDSYSIGGAKDGYTLSSTTINYISDLNQVVNMNSQRAIRYDFDGGSGDILYQMEPIGTPIVITTEIPFKEGYVFGGWATMDDGKVEFKPGDSYLADDSVTLYAVWGKTTISVQDRFVRLGSTVQMDVDIDYNPGFSLISFDVNFDDTVFNLKSVKNGDLFTADQIEFDSLDSPCGIYAEDYDRDKSQNGSIITLTFEIPENCPEGDYPITLTNISAKDIEGNDVEIVGENGILKVRDSVPGDVNGDNEFTYLDVTKLYAIFRQKAPETGLNLDINGDGAFNYLDVTKLYAVFRGKAEL